MAGRPVRRARINSALNNPIQHVIRALNNGELSAADLSKLKLTDADLTMIVYGLLENLRKRIEYAYGYYAEAMSNVGIRPKYVEHTTDNIKETLYLLHGRVDILRRIFDISDYPSVRAELKKIESDLRALKDLPSQEDTIRIAVALAATDMHEAITYLTAQGLTEPEARAVLR